ncbi:MAG: TMEM175 family protein [Propionibacteriaceae bacterium]
MAQQRGLDRIVNLSDAVVAIAATLLVLPLVDSAQELLGQSGREVLAENTNNLLAFVLSFAVICRLWLVHHELYRGVIGFNHALIWANFLWVLCIAFLPFPTELISAGIHDTTNNALYIGTILLANVAFTLQEWIVIRSPELQEESVRQQLVVYPAVVSTIALVLALVIAASLPSVGLYALLLLFPAGWIDSWVTRRRAARAKVAAGAR